MSKVNATWAWASVHPTRLASSVLAAVALASLVFADVSVESFGMVTLLTAVSALLLLPAVAGVGAATACVNEARLPLPESARSRIARAAWAITWTGLATAAANVGQLVGTNAQPTAIVRNILVYTGIGLITIRLAAAQLIWLPIMAYTIGCMMFGYPQNASGYYWWALIMENEATAPQLVGSSMLYVAGLASYVIGPYRRWQ